MDIESPEAPRFLCLRLGIYPSSQVLQTDGRFCHDGPASPMLSKDLPSVGTLPSSGITRLPRYCSPLRHPLVFRPISRGTGYRAYLAPDDFSPGRGGLLQLPRTLLPSCRHYYPAGVNIRFGQLLDAHAAFATRLMARPPGLLIFEATCVFALATA